MGFESATVSATPANGFGADVPVSDAFRVWRAYIGGNEVFTAWHNNLSLGSSAIAILGPNWGTPLGIVDGNYTALLTAGRADSALSQTGMIPSNAESLLFRARPGNGALSVSMNESLVPIIPLATSNGVTEYGADISGLKGTLAELRFTAVPIDVSTPTLNLWYLDSVSFSAQIVPEPSSMVLFGLGAAIVLKSASRCGNSSSIKRSQRSARNST